MNIAKKMLLCAGLPLLLFQFCSCHGELKKSSNDNYSKSVNEITYAENYSVPENFDISRNYELTFWAKNDTNKAQTAVYEKAIEDFQQLYPNITINLRLYTDYNRIYNDVITNISTNTTPNICITYPDHIATYITGNNTVVNLNQLINNEKYGLGGSALKFDAPTKDEIIPEFLSECAFGKSYFALPYMRSSEACYINKTFVEKLGYKLPDVLTWEFIWEVSEAAMEKNSDGTYKLNGQNVMIPFIYKSTDNMMIQMIKQKDAPYSDELGNIYIFNSETENILKSIVTHAQTRAFSTFKISSYPGNYLNSGQCIFAIDSTAGSTWMGANAPLTDIHESKKTNFETVVMPIPQYNVNNPKMISQGPSVCIFNKSDEQEVLASWLFVQYLLTNDIQIAYSKTEGYVPVTSKAQTSKEYLDYLNRSGEDDETYYYIKIDATKIVLNNIENTFITPVFNGSASLRSAAGQMIENVTKSVRRNESINKEYFETLYSDMISLYQLNNVSFENENTYYNNETPSFKSLPTASKMLICILIVIWSFLVIYTVYKHIANNKKNRDK